MQTGKQGKQEQSAGGKLYRIFCYDIRFKTRVPEVDRIVELIINIEVQVDPTPGYPILKRGIYYCSRMLSEQFGTEFLDEHYEDMKKVVSIWI